MSSIWTDSQISSWAQEAENQISIQLNLILDRIGLATSQGQSDFNLPSYINSIRRVTFQGFRLDPSSFSEVVTTISSPGAVISSSRPLTYVYDGFGTNVIKLYPSVGVVTSAPTGDLFNAVGIQAGLVIEVWRTPDFTTCYNRVPDWFRRVITKAYVLQRALASEGPGQDLKGSAYFEEEFNELMKILGSVNSTVFLSRQRVMGDSEGFFKHNWRARPMLPPNYPLR